MTKRALRGSELHGSAMSTQGMYKCELWVRVRLDEKTVKRK